MAKPKELTYYKLNLIPGTEKNYDITKFDSDLNVMSGPYKMSFIPSKDGRGYYDCNCPASKFDCRHKSIMRAIVDAGQANGDKFYCFETRTFKSAGEI